MCAIEKITSKTTEIHIASADAESPSDVIEVPVWNNTVANLTLMALGLFATNSTLKDLTTNFEFYTKTLIFYKLQSMHYS